MAYSVLSLVVNARDIQMAISVPKSPDLGCLREKLVCTMAFLKNRERYIRYYEVAPISANIGELK